MVLGKKMIHALLYRIASVRLYEAKTKAWYIEESE